MNELTSWVESDVTLTLPMWAVLCLSILVLAGAFFACLMTYVVLEPRIERIRDRIYIARRKRAEVKAAAMVQRYLWYKPADGVVGYAILDDADEVAYWTLPGDDFLDDDLDDILMRICVHIAMGQYRPDVVPTFSSRRMPR